MKFSCEQCGANYAIADEKIGHRGAKVKCKKCSHMIVLAPISAADPTVVDQQPMEETVANETLAEGSVMPQENRTELSGAFDAMVARPDQQQQTDQDSEQIWYVALAEGQAGPLRLEEVEHHILQGRLTGQSLAWKAGMSDWLPIANIDTLKALIKADPRRAANKPQVSAAVVAEHAAAAKTIGKEWEPAAKKLSDLAKEEILQKNNKADESKSKGGFGGLDLPDLGSSSQDIFGSGGLGNQNNTSHEGQWSAPSPRRRRSEGQGMMVTIVVIALIAVAGIGAAVYLGLKSQPTQVVVAAPPAPAPAPPPVAAAPPTTAQAAAPQQASPAPAEGGKENAKATADDDDDDESPAKKTKQKLAKKEPREPKEVKKPAPAEAPAAAKASLSKEDIMNTVRENARKITPCLQAARSKGEIPANTYTFTLGWTIKTDGSVSNASLTGPAPVLSTSLPSCFANVVSQWRFPSSGAEVPIRNFPLGPIKVP